MPVIPRYLICAALTGFPGVLKFPSTIAAMTAVFSNAAGVLRATRTSVAVDKLGCMFELELGIYTLESYTRRQIHIQTTATQDMNTYTHTSISVDPNSF